MSETREQKIDALADALSNMFGGGSDGVVYAKAIEREKVRRLLHELLSDHIASMEAAAPGYGERRRKIKEGG